MDKPSICLLRASSARDRMAVEGIWYKRMYDKFSASKRIAAYLDSQVVVLSVVLCGVIFASLEKTSVVLCLAS